MRSVAGPGPLTRYLASHGWRISRYRDGLRAFQLGQTVASIGVTPAFVGRIAHLEVGRGRRLGGPKLDLHAVVVVTADGTRSMALPPWLWCATTGRPALRLAASSGD